MLTIVVIHGHHAFLIRVYAEACIRVLVVAVGHELVLHRLMVLLLHFWRRFY